MDSGFITHKPRGVDPGVKIGGMASLVVGNKSVHLDGE